MRRSFFVISLVLLFLASCERHKSTEDFSQQSSECVVFPVFDTLTLLKGSIGLDEYLVFVEHSGSQSVQGHYMPLDRLSADTVAFRIVADGGKARLYYGDEEMVVRPRQLVAADGHLEGLARLGLFRATKFQLSEWKVPPFRSYEDGRYQKQLFSVECKRNIHYASANGYWDEMDDETAVSDKIFNMGKAVKEHPLDLRLDLYLPQGDTLSRRPMVMLAHGGAFYFGSKDDKSVVNWCKHLASMGYVAASIDYRLGFIPNKAGVSRAGYRAVQDAHAAMRYLVSEQETYGIDTSMLFVGGCSAGAITALNLAYMTSDNRPIHTYADRHHPDLGDIDTCGNALRCDFSLKGIVDMWGAVPDTALMRGHHEPILAFHGDADNIVPYGYDYPFRVAGAVKNLLVDKMYGSSCIVDNARKSGNKAQMVTFEGYRHSPHVDPNTKKLNHNFYTIQSTMTRFFDGIVEPERPALVEEEGQWFRVEPQPLESSWSVDGGVAVETVDDKIRVIWIDNAPVHSVTVSAAMPRGVGFNDSINEKSHP